MSGTSESLGFQLHVWVGVKGLRGLSLGSCKLGFLLISCWGGGGGVYCYISHSDFVSFSSLDELCFENCSQKCARVMLVIA